MSLPRLVLCLTLLASSLGWAQGSEEWTPYTPPTKEAATPPPLVPAPPAPEDSPPPQAPEQVPPQGELIPRDAAPESQTALRLIITPWSGAVAGLMGLIVGVIPTAIIALPFCVGLNNFEEPRCGIAFGAGISVSYVVGVTLGVAFTGKLLGGQGDGLVTFLGALAGAAAGSGIGVASQSTGALVLGLTLGPLIGAVISYEVSHARALLPMGPESLARAGFQVMPVVSATPRGGLLGGLAGRF